MEVRGMLHCFLVKQILDGNVRVHKEKYMERMIQKIKRVIPSQQQRLEM